MKLVLATSNPGKLKEIQALLSVPDVTIVPQSEYNVIDAEETGLTLVENAIIKARHACEHTGLPALSDDTGLVIDYLNGEPGVYSARYSGIPVNSERNVEKVLKALEGVPEQKRRAAFYCVMVFMQHPKDPVPLIVQGEWHGRIAKTKAGIHGFGYDSIFYVEEYQMTAAEISPELKNQISHRGQALANLISVFPCANCFNKLD